MTFLIHEAKVVKKLLFTQHRPFLLGSFECIPSFVCTFNQRKDFAVLQDERSQSALHFLPIAERRNGFMSFFKSISAKFQPEFELILLILFPIPITIIPITYLTYSINDIYQNHDRKLQEMPNFLFF